MGEEELAEIERHCDPPCLESPFVRDAVRRLVELVRRQRTQLARVTGAGDTTEPEGDAREGCH